MTKFDQDHWDAHWREAGGRDVPVHPYLARETADLVPGTALDAGCGEGAEARWLAAAGWQVTAADISEEVLARAAAYPLEDGATGSVSWVRADLGSWEPGTAYDLVTTHYAHPVGPQLAFYERLAGWVAPGGTLLVVAHHDTGADHGHGRGPDPEASVTAASTAALLDPGDWDVVTAAEESREHGSGHEHGHGGHRLHDVVVRAVRRA